MNLPSKIISSATTPPKVVAPIPEEILSPLGVQLTGTEETVVVKHDTTMSTITATVLPPEDENLTVSNTVDPMIRNLSSVPDSPDMHSTSSNSTKVSITQSNVTDTTPLNNNNNKNDDENISSGDTVSVKDSSSTKSGGAVKRRNWIHEGEGGSPIVEFEE